MLFIFLVWHKIASSVHRFSIEIETISRNEFLPTWNNFLFFHNIRCIFLFLFSSFSLLVIFSLFSLSLSPSFTFLHFTLSLICLLLLSLLLFMCKLKWRSFWEHILLLILILRITEHTKHQTRQLKRRSFLYSLCAGCMHYILRGRNFSVSVSTMAVSYCAASFSFSLSFCICIDFLTK